MFVIIVKNWFVKMIIWVNMKSNIWGLYLLCVNIMDSEKCI